MQHVDKPPSVTKVLFQLSAIRKERTNWKKCATFFHRAQEFPDAVLCYVSLHEFQSYVPKQAAAEHLSAYDARLQVVGALGSNCRLLLLDGAMLDQWFRLPVRQIMEDLQLPDMAHVTEHFHRLTESPVKFK